MNILSIICECHTALTKYNKPLVLNLFDIQNQSFQWTVSADFGFQTLLGTSFLAMQSAFPSDITLLVSSNSAQLLCYCSRGIAEI